jgi:arginase family enzyme
LRRFFVKVGPLKNAEYETDISNLRVSDYGNIYLKEDLKATLEQLLEKLGTKVASVYAKNNIPLVLGGSRECSVAAIQKFISKYLYNTSPH